MRKKRYLWFGFVVIALATLLVYTNFFAAAQGIRIQYGETVDGEINGTGDTDVWLFDGARGDVITVRISRTGGDLVPFVSLVDPDNAILLNLDWPAQGPPDVLFTVSLRTTGPHTLTIQGAAGTTGTYTLSLELQETGLQEEGVLAYGRVVSGEITDATFREFWTFRGTRGDVIDIMMTTTSGDLDAYLSLVSPQGNVLLSSDSGGAGTDAALFAVRLPSSGNFSVVARRAGANFGENSATQGAYDLSLTLRIPGSDEGTVTPAGLVLGVGTRGRLNADAPTALFSVEAEENVLALALDLTNDAQVGTLSVMTPERALLGTFSGVSPLRASVTLPNPGLYWIEVAVIGVREANPVDFALAVDQLTTAQRGSRPIQYNKPQTILSSSVQPDAWHFSGQAGDLVKIHLTPFNPTVEGSQLQVFSPDGSLLVTRSVRNTTIQPLLLTSRGQYEIVLDSAALSAGYQMTVTQQGLAGLSFRQHAYPQLQGTLLPGIASAVTRALSAGGADEWLFDVPEAHNWHFQLSQTGSDVPLAIAVDMPDGEWLAFKTTKRLTNAVALQSFLPHPGRYRVIVFDPTGTAPHNYTLWGGPTEGGHLELNTPVKGVLTGQSPMDRWELSIPANSLLNIDVDVTAGNNVPDIHVIRPDGLLAATNTRGEQRNALQLTGVPVNSGGQFEILVTQPQNSERLVYHIKANIVFPFEESATTPLTVNASVNVSASEVFATSTQPVPPVNHVILGDQLTPPIQAGADYLAAARPIELETLIRGDVPEGQRYQAWQFPANAGQLLGFSVVALDDVSGPDVVVLNNEGSILVENFKDQATTNYLTHRFQTSGTYTVVVKLDQGGRYTLFVDVLSGLDETLPAMVTGDVVSYGETVVGEIVRSYDVHTYVFWGKSGDVISARALRTQGNANLKIALLELDGTALREATMIDSPIDSPPAAEIDAYTLPANGLYQLTAFHEGAISNITGRFALYIDLIETPAAKRAGGALSFPHIASLEAGDPAHHWLFSAQSGEQVTVRVEPLTAGAPSPLTLQLTDSAGNVFLQKESLVGHGALIFENVILPRSGVYQALVSGGRQPGVYRITLERDSRNTQDIEHAIRYGETAGKVLNRENYLDVWTFVGSPGDLVTAVVRPVRGDAPLIGLQLRAQNDLVLGTIASDGASARLERIRLPFDGHYSILVGNTHGNFNGEAAYEITLYLEDATARSMGTVLTYGQSVTGNYFLDDRADAWVFEGRQGDIVTATVVGDSPTLQPSLDLIATDWRAVGDGGQVVVLASAQATADEAAVIQFVLPATGPYALLTRDPTYAGGTYTLDLNAQSMTANMPGTIRYGQDKTGQIGSIHLSDAWTFQGTFGDAVTITVDPDSRSHLAPLVSLIGPDGHILAAGRALAGDIAEINAYPLPRSGLYTVQVSRYLDAQGYTDGRYTLFLEQVVADDFNYPVTIYGQIQRSVLGDNSPVNNWRLTGQPGDVVRVYAEATSGDLDLQLSLVDADGNVLGSADDQHTVDQGLNAEMYVWLPDTAPYVIKVARYGKEQGVTEGNYALVVEPAYRFEPIDAERTLTYGDRVAGSVDRQSTSDVWAFMGEQGDSIHAKIQFPRDDAPLSLFLRDPAGNVLATGERDRGDSIIDGFVLPYQGAYTLEIRYPGDARAAHNPYALDLTLVTASSDQQPVQGGWVALGQTVTGVFADAPVSHTWLFEGNALAAVSLTLNRLTGALPQQLVLYAPNGTPVFVIDSPAGSVNVLSTGTINLPLDGLYTLLITGDEAVIGATYRLSLRVEQPQAIPAAQDLMPLRDGFGVIAGAHLSDHWTFTAEAGDVVSLRVSANSGNLEPTLMLWGPDNRPLIEGTQEQIGQTAIASVIAPLTGTYQVTVGRMGNTSGEYRLLLRQMPISSQAASARDVAFGTQVLGYTESASPTYYAFRGLAGDVVGISVKLTEAGQVPGLTLETEAGTDLRTITIDTVDETLIPAFVLPEDGRYIVRLDSVETVGYAFSVFRRSPDTPPNGVTRSLSWGRTLAEGVLYPDQPTYWTFPGEAGDVLTFTVDTSGGGLQADVTLYGPRGYIANNVEHPGPSVTLGPLRLPDDGDYILLVGPWLGEIGGSTGRYSVRVDEAEAGVSGSDGGHIVARNQVVTGGLTAEDAQDTWTFDGRAGEVVTIRAEQTRGDGSLSLALAAPGGDSLANSEPGTTYLGAEIARITLPSTGIYSFTVGGRTAGDDSVEYRLVVLQEQSAIAASMADGQGIVFGESQTGVLLNNQDYDAWVFFGQAGERIQSEVIPSDAAFAPELYLLGPDGHILQTSANSLAGGSARLADVTLLDSGFYGLVVGGNHAEQVEYVIQLERLVVGTTSAGTLRIDAADLSTGWVTTTAPVQRWTLTPTYNGSYLVEVVPLAAGVNFDVFVLDIENTLLSTGMSQTRGVAQAAVYMEAGEVYTAQVSGGPAVVQGRYAIRLVPASEVTHGSTLESGSSEIGRIDRDTLNNEWRIQGRADAIWAFDINRIGGDLVLQVSVVGPDGAELQREVAGDDGTLAMTFQIPVDGQYAIAVTHVDGSTTGDYTITAQITE